jgi:hypothetical protein
MPNQEDYEKLIKSFYKFKSLFESYTIKLKENDKEALAKGLYGMFDMTLTMDKVSELYQIIKSDAKMHYDYYQIVKNESLFLMNKIHTDEEIKLMPYLTEKHLIEHQVDISIDNKKSKFKV